MLNLDTETFKKEVENYNGYAVVDFYTSTCGPCRVMAPLFKASEPKHPNVKYGKIEVSDGQDVFVNYDVRYVPTFIFFKDGKEVSRKAFMNEKELEDWVSENEQK